MKGLVLFIALIIWGNLLAQADSAILLKPTKLGEIKVVGFVLNHPQQISIRAEGAGKRIPGREIRSFMEDPEQMFAYAWILDAQDRSLVWRMTLDNTRRNWQTRYNRKFEGELKLPSGKYEVYYSARKPYFHLYGDGFFSLGRFLDRLLSDESWLDRDRKKWFIQIKGVDEVIPPEALGKYHRALKEQAVVSITALRNSEYRQKGIRLTEKGTFQIYALGEAYKGEEFDYGWIVRAGDSKKIWEMTAESGKYAGGAIKNKVWRERITLEPGEYWIYFIMDDSHGPHDWNANPPYDPDFWGITLTGVPGEYQPQSVTRIQEIEVEPIVSLNRLGDNELVQAGFRIAQAVKIRIYALGEGRRGKMYDYGWIVNLDTGKEVWRMKYNRTRYAGGARKNRLVDEVIELPRGSYVVYFRTDDSHSYRHWNSAPPYNPERWGITIYPADPKYSEGRIEPLEDLTSEENILAQIVEVEDDIRVQERFQLEQPSRIRIYAIGEGDWGEMYDYGWIEKQFTHEKVWMMEYDKTVWAGGARKNRKVDEVITLPPGKYILCFQTDGSHSFADWNADPPDDPAHYGITLYLIHKGEGE